ncbi:MAG: hypothetical protein LBT40_01145 [Deltaproteobacteria bacterium]|jgi:hypothetical protein|nr:hypothetical protein [Deltaproteobacteria bacterium]
MSSKLKTRLKAGATALAIAVCMAAVPAVHMLAAARADQKVAAARDRFQQGSEMSLRDTSPTLAPGDVLDPRFREVPKAVAETVTRGGGPAGPAEDMAPALAEMGRAAKRQVETGRSSDPLPPPEAGSGTSGNPLTVVPEAPAS